MGASAGKAGFLTAVYILLVPILGLFLHKKMWDKYLVCSCSGTGWTVFSVYAG